MHWFTRKPYIALLVSMAIVASIPLLCGLLLYLGSTRLMNAQMDEITNSSILLYRQEVDGYLKALNRISMKIAASSRVRAAMSLGTELSAADRITIRECREELKDSISGGVDCITGIYILNNNTGFTVTDSAMYDSADLVYNHYYNAYGVGRDEFAKVHSEYNSGSFMRLGKDKKLLIYCRSLPYYSSAGVPVKQLVIVLNRYFFDNLVQTDNTMDGVYFMLDGDGNVLFFSNRSDVNITDGQLAGLRGMKNGSAVKLDGRKMTLHTMPSSAGPYTAGGLIGQSGLKSRVVTLQFIGWIALAVCAALASLAVLVLSRKNYTPIDKLLRYLRENYSGNAGDDKGIHTIQETVQMLISEKNDADQKLESYNRAMGINHLKSMLQGSPSGYPREMPGQRPGDHWADGTKLAVVCFSSSGQQNAGGSGGEDEIPLERQEQVIRVACGAALPGDCLWEIISIEPYVVAVFGSRDGNRKADWAVKCTEKVILELEEGNELSSQASVSNMHAGVASLEFAYREALLAMEYGRTQEDTIITRFDTCEFKADLFLRDWVHIDKLLRFTHLACSGHIKEAQEYLDSLFPDVFMNGILPESEISALQLSSLKYQFLHTADGIFELYDTAPENRNETITSILGCKNHRELKEVMRQFLVSTGEQLPQENAMTGITLQAVISFISDQYWDNQLSATSIASHFNISANTLSKYFRRKAGIGLLQYIHEVRAGMARELLQNRPELTITQVAEKVGYANKLTFTREFKSVTGETPGDFRKAAGKR